MWTTRMICDGGAMTGVRDGCNRRRRKLPPTQANLIAIAHALRSQAPQRKAKASTRAQTREKLDSFIFSQESGLHPWRDVSLDLRTHSPTHLLYSSTLSIYHPKHGFKYTHLQMKRLHHLHSCIAWILLSNEWYKLSCNILIDCKLASILVTVGHTYSCWINSFISRISAHFDCCMYIKL
jgi:hypothetical protein